MNRGLEKHLLLESPGVFLLPPYIQQRPPTEQRRVGLDGGIWHMELETQTSPAPSVCFF